MYKATITVRRRPSILDPEGKAMEHALTLLDFKQLTNVRTGKLIELLVDAADEKSAHEAVSQACVKLLANPVMEDFSFTLEPID
jgi:phosphoribosylformylglycinamidine synthase